MKLRVFLIRLFVLFSKFLRRNTFMNNKVNNKRDLTLSKKLSYLLRHGATKEGICIKPDGFVSVEELLRKKLSGYTLSDIERVVNNNDKQRFSLVVDNGIAEIRANQGHSLSLISQLNLKPVKDPNFDIIHGTYLDNWTNIKIKGLSRITRNHIHFAKGLNFVCGLRKSAKVYIYIDFHKADESGLQFLESVNGVILCTGDANGLIKPDFFLKVTTKYGDTLLPECL